MTGFILRLLIVALGLWLASEWVPGIEVKGMGTLLGAALMLGIVNAVVRPLLIVLTATAYGLKWNRLSSFQQKHMVLTKLLLALVLFGLAAFITIG